MNSFDQHQFYRRSFPVQAHATREGFQTTGLSYEDAKKTQVAERAFKNVRWIPAFAANRRALRHVLLVKAWRVLYNKVPMPSHLDWHSLCGKMPEALKLSEDIPPNKKLENAHHLEAAGKAGGVLELYAAIAYRSWRLGYNSVQVAEEVRCSPCQVRQILQRICRVAEQLGYETFPPHHSRKHSDIKRTIRRCGPPVQIDPSAIARLRQDGLSYTKIATKLGASRSGIFAALRREKKKAGQESPALQTNCAPSCLPLPC